VHDPKQYILYLTQNRLLNTSMDANMQLTINSFRQLFPDKVFSLTPPICSKIPGICCVVNVFRFRYMALRLVLWGKLI